MAADRAPQDFAPGLWLVATPIGNLSDMSPRGLAALAAADLILAEDTRVARRLMGFFGLKGAVERCDEAATQAGYAKATPVLAAGGTVMFVADAGSPVISDPGARLAQLALADGHEVHAVPGPSAVLMALAVSGLVATQFTFCGFLPARSSARLRFVAARAALTGALVFFETGPRLAESLTDLASVFGARTACVARELTKKFEEKRRGTLSALAAHYATAPTPKGEIVLVIDGCPEPTEADGPDLSQVRTALSAALDHGPVKQSAAMVAAAFGLPRRDVYAMALALKAPADDD